jgi:alpha-tubulin suppressor-like RCC1 family protein
VTPGLSGVTAIAGGYAQALALKSDGTVVGWGQFGWMSPTVPPGLSGVAAISAGWLHDLTLQSDGTVLGWGMDNYGQVDIPTAFAGVNPVLDWTVTLTKGSPNGDGSVDLTAVTNQDSWSAYGCVDLIASDGSIADQGWGSSGDHFTTVFAVSVPGTYHAIVDTDCNGGGILATSGTVTVP